MADTLQGTSNRISELISQLEDANGLKRQQARIELVGFEQASVSALINALSHPVEHVRWEAAKALQEIHDPEAATALVQALNDKVADVRWAAAGALLPLKEAAILPLVEGLIEYYNSGRFRRIAHYVLRNLEKDNLLSQPVKKVYQALGEMEPQLTVPLVALAALEELKK